MFGSEVEGMKHTSCDSVGTLVPPLVLGWTADFPASEYTKPEAWSSYRRRQPEVSGLWWLWDTLPLRLSSGQAGSQSMGPSVRSKH